MNNSVNKRLYRYELWLVKVIPIIIAGIFLVSTILSYHYIDLVAFAQFGGVSVLTLLFLYLSSFAFGFDISHRIFIYYIIICWILQLIDYYIGIPLNNKALYIMYLSITGLAVLTYGYVKRREHNKRNCFLGDDTGTVMEQQTTEKSGSDKKRMYRYELLLIKLIPIIISGLIVINTALSYFGVDWEFFSHLVGASFLSILLMYVSSIVFKFCAYHRIFIHYITIVWILNIVDWYTELFDNRRDFLLLVVIAAGITIFAAIILKIKKI